MARSRLALTLSVLGTLLASTALGACSAGQTTAPSITQVSPTSGRLQFAVGTANIYGNTANLNVVSTFRQADGRSAVGVNTPFITGPVAFTVGPEPSMGGNLPDPYTTIPDAGPSLPETLLAAPAITGTPQTVAAGTPFCDTIGNVAGFVTCPAGHTPNDTSFGQSGGVFAMGLAPYNSVGSTGQSYSYVPYAQPIYDSGAAAPTFVPWGGPPAFDPDKNGMGTRDGLVPLGVDSFNLPYFLGVGEGLTAFEGVTPESGAYTLTAQIATIGNGGSVTVSKLTASASMNPSLTLPTVSAPFVTPDANGDGGASMNVTLPAGATEGYIQIVDYGPLAGPNNGGGTASNCQGPKGASFAPVYYTIHVTASGAFNLPSSDGPNTNLNGGDSNLTPSHSICTEADNSADASTNAGDNFVVQFIAFDYPIYNAAVGLLTSPSETPQITGANGQSDVTISLPVEEDWQSGDTWSATTLTHSRHPLHRVRPRVIPRRIP
jgi:hypothetical protein